MRQNSGSGALWRNTTTLGKLCHEVKGSLKTHHPVTIPKLGGWSEGVFLQSLPPKWTSPSSGDPRLSS